MCGEAFATTYCDTRDLWVYKESTVSPVSPPSLVHKHCALVQLQEVRALEEANRTVVKEEEDVVVKEEDGVVVKEEGGMVKEEDE